MTVEDQYAVIRTSKFLTDVIIQYKKVRAGLTSLGLTVNGSLSFIISGVKVTVTEMGVDAQVEAGLSDDGSNPLYIGKMPLAWLS